MEQLDKKYPNLLPKMPVSAPEQEVDPCELKDADPEVLAKAAEGFLDAKKAFDISVLDVEEKTSLASYFVICTATSSTHAKALGDELDYQTTRRGASPLHTEGRAGGAWVLLDYGSVIVHIFTRDARDFYRIERLYENGENV